LDCGWRRGWCLNAARAAIADDVPVADDDLDIMRAAGFFTLGVNRYLCLRHFVIIRESCGRVALSLTYQPGMLQSFCT
jgi:hypothetical protein